MRVSKYITYAVKKFCSRRHNDFVMLLYNTFRHKSSVSAKKLKILFRLLFLLVVAVASVFAPLFFVCLVPLASLLAFLRQLSHLFVG